MTDSFFTSRNFFDQQASGFCAIQCDQLIEASCRRLVELEGPLATAERLQRLSDICSGAYVLPIEHWKEASQSDQTSVSTRDADRSLVGGLRRFFSKFPIVAFWLGIFVGLYLGGRTDA